MFLFNYVKDLVTFEQSLVVLAEAKRLAVDCETYTLPAYESAKYKAANLRTNSHTGAVSLVSVCAEDKLPYVFDLICLKDLGCNLQKLGDLLRTREYCLAHFAKFERKMLEKDLGIINNWRCTLVLAQLYGNATGSKLWRSRGLGLADLCRDWLNVTMTGKGGLQITQWYSDPSSRNLDNEHWVEKLKYAAADTKYLFQLHDILYPLVVNPLPKTPLLPQGSSSGNYGWGMDKCLKLENYLINIVADLEVAGLPYNDLVGKKFAKAIISKKKKLGVEICQALKLDLVTEGLWGDLVPSPEAQTALNNPVKLCKLINKNSALTLSNSQAAVLQRALDVLKELAKAETEAREAQVEYIEGENELYGDLDSLSLAAMEHGFTLLQKIVDYKRLVKQSGMFLSEYVNPASGRIHSNMSSGAAATGRFACLASDTKIATMNGWQNISDIKVGDFVFCVDDDNRLCQKPVLNVWNKGVRETIKVSWNQRFSSTSDKFIICTPDHLFKVRQGWLKAKKLSSRSHICSASIYEYDFGIYNYKGVAGRRASFWQYSLWEHVTNEPVEVWDIEVADYNNFIAEGLCVHNSSNPNVQQVSARLYVEAEFTIDELKSLIDVIE